jgi:steroid delta-isomerase-like uncharacterized protein
METINFSNSIAATNIEQFFQTHDVAYLAEDVTYTNMATGDKIEGRQAVADMLNYFFHVAFEAKAVIRKTVITESSALLEASIVGKHIGEVAGIPPTGKQVNIPYCVVYDLNRDSMIQAARIYMLTEVLAQQLK